MIGFAICIGSRDVYRRYAQPGIARCGDGDSAVAEIETDSIFAGYNEALDAFAPMSELEALVLLHEDVELRDPQLCAKLRRRFADESIAVIGPVGARGVRSLCWWEGEIHGRVTETRGVIDHGGGCHDVEAVDGLFMALSPWAVRELRFDDTRFSGFHGYDVDLCLQADAAGRRVVVDELEMTHHTRGGLGDAAGFWQADAALRAKWSARGRPMAPDAEMAPEHRGFAVARAGEPMSYADAIAQVSQIENQIASLQTAFVAKTGSAAATGTAEAGAARTSAGAPSSTFASQLSQALAGQSSAAGSGEGSDLASELTSGDGAGLSSLYAGGATYPTTLSATGTTTSLGALTSTGATGGTGATAALPSRASSLLSSDQQQFASRLASDTGLDPGVVSAWLLAEESGSAATGRQSAGNNDWLNIGYTDGGTYGGADSVWSDPVTAADATAGWLKGQDTIPDYGTASSGVQAILGTAGQPAAAQISALQTSGWASSGYPDLSSLYAQVTA